MGLCVVRLEKPSTRNFFERAGFSLPFDGFDEFSFLSVFFRSYPFREIPFQSGLMEFSYSFQDISLDQNACLHLGLFFQISKLPLQRSFNKI